MRRLKNNDVFLNFHFAPNKWQHFDNQSCDYQAN